MQFDEGAVLHIEGAAIESGQRARFVDRGSAAYEQLGTFTCPAEPGSGFVDIDCPLPLGALPAEERYLTDPDFESTVDPFATHLSDYLPGTDLVTVEFEALGDALPAAIACTTGPTGAPACEYPVDWVNIIGRYTPPAFGPDPQFEAVGGFTPWEAQLYESGDGSYVPGNFNGELIRTDDPSLWPHPDPVNGRFLFTPQEVQRLKWSLVPNGAYKLGWTWITTVTPYKWMSGYGPPSNPRLMMVI